MDKQYSIGVFMVNNKGFTYWTKSNEAFKSKSKEAPSQKKKKQEPPAKKEKTTSDEHVKPLAAKNS